LKSLHHVKGQGALRYIRSDAWLAWCAGVFDGEGYVGLKAGSKGSSKKYFGCCVTQKDPRLLRKFRRIVRMGTITGPNGAGCHNWQLYNSGDILRLFEMLWPYLGPVKRNQFTQALKGWFKQKKQYGRVRP